jgi:enolase
MRKKIFNHRILAVSLAIARAGAAASKMPLYRYIGI